MMQRGGWLKTRDRWYRVQVEWEPVSEWWERERGGHVCLRHLQDDIGRTHRSAASSILPLPKGTSYHTLSLSFFLSLHVSFSLAHISTPSSSSTHTHTHLRPAPGDVALPGRTHPQPPIGCWKPATLPLLPSQRDSAWKQRGCCTVSTTGHCCSAALIPHHPVKTTSDRLSNDNIHERLNSTWEWVCDWGRGANGEVFSVLTFVRHSPHVPKFIFIIFKSCVVWIQENTGTRYLHFNRSKQSIM